VTPEFARSLVAAGFGNLDSDDLTEARAVGVTGDYVRALRAAGVAGDLEDFVQLRAVGVRPEYVQSLRQQGHNVRDPDKLVDLWAIGNVSSLPPRPPKPPRVPPTNWDPTNDDGG